MCHKQNAKDVPGDAEILESFLHSSGLPHVFHLSAKEFNPPAMETRPLR